MQLRNPSLPLFAIAVLAAATLSGCLIGSSSHTTTTGRYVSAETLAKVEPGKPREYVVALLGEPSEKTALPDGTEIWKWHSSAKKSSDTAIFLLLGAENETTSEHTTYVELKDGVVVRTWRD